MHSLHTDMWKGFEEIKSLVHSHTIDLEIIQRDAHSTRHHYNNMTICRIVMWDWRKTFIAKMTELMKTRDEMTSLVLKTRTEISGLVLRIGSNGSVVLGRHLFADTALTLVHALWSDFTLPYLNPLSLFDDAKREEVYGILFVSYSLSCKESIIYLCTCLTLVDI